ncbi:hypothetical protein AB0I28_06250 [Phytomonospora sp. NPDC050363]|uniref:hypothetical protein n=1 Tax=Phytomonospora sp. NPDC050363 TaxID=3155642 RepID=UPI0034003263
MINAQVRGETGEVLVRGESGLNWSNEMAGLDRSSFPMIGHVCPYTDTIFNSWQVPTLMDELLRLPAGVASAETIEELRSLCQFVLDGPHRYLWFLGD